MDVVAKLIGCDSAAVTIDPTLNGALSALFVVRATNGARLIVKRVPVQDISSIAPEICLRMHLFEREGLFYKSRPGQYLWSDDSCAQTAKIRSRFHRLGALG
jgi:hypothetical protein